MAMSVGSDGDGDGKAMSDINTTPLVDVMLVLLIIFLITVPVVIQTAPVDLPKVASIPLQTKPENIVISVDVDGNVYWGASLIKGGKSELREMVKERVINAVQAGQPIPEVHIRGDRNTPYQYIGGVIFNVQMAGIPKVGFVSEPPAGMITAR
ncbi:MAG TPA: biopolymer transporter ExbD [Pedomonas sp.]|uniref:ExbD/TolR family protein n=1 Tax=Pedomonas sp. TaxID=2976421 RepID=UPI002F4249B9